MKRADAISDAVKSAVDRLKSAVDDTSGNIEEYEQRIDEKSDVLKNALKGFSAEVAHFLASIFCNLS